MVVRRSAVQRSAKPKRKRANGTGSIWWDDKRQRYMGQITVYDVAGTVRRRTVSARTQAELDTRLRRLQNATDATVDAPANWTVSGFLTYWLDEVLPLENKAPRTVRSYQEVCRYYIDPHLGRIELAELTPVHVRKMMAALTAKGYAPSTVSRARKTLSRALRTALRDELVTRNVAQLVDGVSIPRSEKGTLTPEQAAVLLEVAEAEGHGTLVGIMLGLGLRRQETLGLLWRDLDLDATHPTLTVSGVIAQDVDRRPFWSAKAKTAASRRRLHLPASLVASLRRHRATQSRDRLACVGPWARDWPHDDFVFTTSVGTPLDLDNTTKLVIRLAEQAGIGHWTPHGLRHSAASILMAQDGVDLKQVSDTLGHSSIRVTADVYGHQMEPSRRDVAEAMEKAIFS